MVADSGLIVVEFAIPLRPVRIAIKLIDLVGLVFGNPRLLPVCFSYYCFRYC